MCGIAGVWATRGTSHPGELSEIVARMTHAMTHRGPDGSGMWADHERGLVLGHRRLAVVDLAETGRQPMTSANGRWTITFNGELYEDSELRRVLEADGTRFRGRSDTEVLVEAIAHFGLRETIDRIDGMYAFAVWDAERHELHLVRDRFGEKPLCYGTVGGRFVFASDTAAVRAGFPHGLSIDPEAVYRFLELRAVPSPLSIHRELRKVPAGHGVTVGTDGGVTRWCHWDLWEAAQAGYDDPLVVQPEEAAEQLHAVMQRSVSARLRADVPVGVFLSGGVDSSLVAAVAAEVTNHPVKTFTIGFDDARYDESVHAATVARSLGTEHCGLRLSPAEALRVVPSLVDIYDEPFADSSQLPTHLVSKLAGEQVTVALSGDGADELFGGYNRHQRLPQVWRRLQHVPVGARGVLARCLLWPPPSAVEAVVARLPASRRIRQPALKLQKLARAIGATDGAELYRSTLRLWDPPPVPSTAPPLHVFNGLLPYAHQLLLADTGGYLEHDILAKVDRASMAVGLEVRAPYLAAEVVQFALRLPLHQRLNHRETKLPLRRLLHDLVPDTTWDRPKTGFGIPLGEWLAGPLAGWANDHLHSGVLDQVGIDRTRVMRTWAEAQRQPDTLAPYLIWDVIMLSAFLQRHSGTQPGHQSPEPVRDNSDVPT